MKRPTLHHLLWLSVVATGAAACGEDEPPPPPPKKAGEAAAARPNSGNRPGAGSGNTLPTFRRVEDRAADDKERGSLRHQFRDTDFSFDPTGTMNRDPFRSYVISQPGVTSGETGLSAEPTDLCPAKKQIAQSSSARELKLNGIVSRGTTRWALFQEGQGMQKGHIVHVDDCLGKEKARITKMGSTFVDAEITPEAPATNQPPRPVEKVTWQLHPKQLPIAEDLEGRDPEPSRMPNGGRVTPGIAPTGGGGS